MSFFKKVFGLPSSGSSSSSAAPAPAVGSVSMSNSNLETYVNSSLRSIRNDQEKIAASHVFNYYKAVFESLKLIDTISKSIKPDNPDPSVYIDPSYKTTLTSLVGELIAKRSQLKSTQASTSKIGVIDKFESIQTEIFENYLQNLMLIDNVIKGVNKILKLDDAKIQAEADKWSYIDSMVRLAGLQSRLRELMKPIVPRAGGARRRTKQSRGRATKGRKTRKARRSQSRRKVAA